MLDRETLTKLDDMAGRLLRLANERTDAGDRAGALAAANAADHVMVLLDLDDLSYRAGERSLPLTRAVVGMDWGSGPAHPRPSVTGEAVGGCSRRRRRVQLPAGAVTQ